MMKMRRIGRGRARLLYSVTLAGLALALVQGCSRRAGDGQAANGAGGYPAPRFLVSLLNPTQDDLVRAARIAVRQTHGMSPLGKIETGQTVHVVLPYSQDMAVWEALKQAWAERGVTAVAVRPWEVTGEDAGAYAALARANVTHGDEAWKEIGNFDTVYYPYFSPDIQKELGDLKWAERGKVYHKALKPYLEKHPEIRWFMSDAGGGPNWLSVALGDKLMERFAGNWTYITRASLISKGSEYPGDLWNMVEDKLIAPIEHVSEGTFTDPQGTDLHWVITPEQARKWKQYVALVNNHMFLYPQPMETLRFEGKVSGTANHTGFYPQMTVHLSDHGRVIKVEGGGRTGDMFRLLVDNPRLAGVQFPSTPVKGYWYLAADGFATNPKKARDMDTLIAGSTELPNIFERERAGVIHLSFSSGAGNYDIPLATIEAAIRQGRKTLGPKSADVRDLLYAAQHKIPMGHTAHIHNYFGTMKWKLRDTGEWITRSEKGRIKAFDDPEVRALAARYGDPDTIFSYDWIPAIPGINVPGNYQTYARDPWSWVVNEYKQIKDGSYPYLVRNYDLLRTSADGQGARKK
jgi:hypothetical protein